MSAGIACPGARVQYSINIVMLLVPVPEASAIICFARAMTSARPSPELLAIKSPPGRSAERGASRSSAGEASDGCRPMLNSAGLTSKALASGSRRWRRGVLSPLSHFQIVTDDTPTLSARARTDKPCVSRSDRRCCEKPTGALITAFSPVGGAALLRSRELKTMLNYCQTVNRKLHYSNAPLLNGITFA